MNWKKKTTAEIDAAVAKGNYNGGYEWGPWLLYMRKLYVIGFLGNLAGGITMFTYAAHDQDWFEFGAGCFFGILAPLIIGLSLRRDFKDGEIGKSR